VKITIKEILETVGPLQALCNESLPVKAKYWLSRDLARLQTAKDAFEKSRNELIAKHGEKQEDGNFAVKADGPGYKAFLADIEALLTIEEDVELHPQPLEALGNGTIRADLSKLQRLITEV